MFFVLKSRYDRDIKTRDDKIGTLERNYKSEQKVRLNLDDLASARGMKLLAARVALTNIVKLETPKAASVGRRMAQRAREGLTLSE